MNWGDGSGLCSIAALFPRVALPLNGRAPAQGSTPHGPAPLGLPSCDRQLALQVKTSANTLKPFEAGPFYRISLIT